MSIPGLETLDRPMKESGLLDWAHRLVGDLEKQLRDFLLPYAEVTLVNGNNNNINVKGALLIRVNGPTGAFTITGIAGGATGKLLFLCNPTAQNMTVANQNVLSEANNRILTQTGIDITTTNVGSFILVYVKDRWIVFGSAI